MLSGGTSLFYKDTIYQTYPCLGYYIRTYDHGGSLFSFAGMHYVRFQKVTHAFVAYNLPLFCWDLYLCETSLVNANYRIGPFNHANSNPNIIMELRVNGLWISYIMCIRSTEDRHTSAKYNVHGKEPHDHKMRRKNTFVPSLFIYFFFMYFFFF